MASAYEGKGLKSTHDPTERTNSLIGWAGSKTKANEVFFDSEH